MELAIMADELRAVISVAAEAFGSLPPDLEGRRGTSLLHLAERLSDELAQALGAPPQVA